MPAQGKKYLSISETAKFLGVSIDTIRRWDKNGTLASVRLDGKNRYFDLDQLKALKSNKPLSISEAAATLGISITTLRRLEARGLIIPSRDANGERLYTKESLDQYVTSRDLKRKEATTPIVIPAQAGIQTKEDSGQARMTESAQAVSGMTAQTSLISPLTSTPISPSPERSLGEGWGEGRIHPRETTNNIVKNEVGYSEKSENQNVRVSDDQNIRKSDSIGSSNSPILRSSDSPTHRFSDSLSTLTSRHSNSPISSFFKPQAFAFMAPRLTRPNFAPAFSRNPMFKMAAGATAALFLISILSYSVVMSSKKETTVKTIVPKMEIAGAQVLASTSKALDGNMKFNIPAVFGAPVRFSDTIEVNGTSLFTEDVTVQDKNLTLGTGAFTAGTSTITGLSTTGSLAVNGASNLNGTLDVEGVATFGNVINFGNLSTDPATGVNGAQYYNTTSNIFRCYVNGTWVNCDTDTTSGGTMSSFNIETNGSNSFSVGNGNTVDFIAGSNVTISTNTSDKSITISAAGSSGGMTSFTLAGDSGTNQTISDASTLTVAGGSAISTVTSATGVVTANLDLFTGAGTTATTSSASGLEISSGALSLIRGCNDTQILSWNGTTQEWACTNGGGSSAIINVEEEGTPVGTNVTTLNFAGADFDLTTPVSSSTVYLQISSAIPRKANNETISGSWTYSSATPLTLSNTAPTIAIANTGTLTFSDGTNTLLSIADTGTSGRITTGNATLTALSAGAGSQLCINVSNQIVTCNSGSGGVTGSGTAGQIAFFNGAASITSETSGFGWDTTNKALSITTAVTTGTSSSSAIYLNADTVTSGTGLYVNAGNLTGNGSAIYANTVTTATSGTVISNVGSIAVGNSSSASGEFIGLRGVSYFGGTAGVTGALTGVEAYAQVAANQTINIARGLHAYINNATGTITSARGIQITNPSSSGTITTNYGLYVDTMTKGSTDIGVYIADADTYSLQLASTDGDAASGITFGTDTNLYRSAANTLKTDDAFNVNGNFNVTSAGAISAATGITSSGTITFSGFTSNGGVLYTNGSGVLAQATAGTSTQCLLGGTTPSFGDCSSGGGISGSGTSGQIAFFNGNNSITSETSGFGWDTTNKLFTITSTATTQTAATITASSLTSGSGLSLVGPTTTGIIGGSTGMLSIASDVGTGGSVGQLVYLAPDFSSTTNSQTAYGLRLAATDSTTSGTSKNDYGAYISLALTGDLAKTGYGTWSQVTSTSTTADTLYAYRGTASTNAAISTGTRNVTAFYADPAATGGDSGGTINIYGFRSASSYAANSSGATINVYGGYFDASGIISGGGTSTINTYGVYVPDVFNNSGGTSAGYGIYVANQTGLDAAYGIYIADAANSSLYLASTDGDAASGITFGADTNLYRSAANTLKTDDNFTVNSKLTINTDGDMTSAFTTLDGSTTSNGTGTASTSLVVNSATNFNVGNYVQVSSTNCTSGVNVCYAKITNIAGTTFTISPALTWANGSAVVEVHVPEIGGTNLASTLTNRYGRGYFIDGVVTGNGTTYYTDNNITIVDGETFNFTDGTNTLLSIIDGGTSGNLVAGRYNGLAITNNGTNTLDIAAGKTLTVSNTLTLTGTDGTSFALPASSGTICTVEAGNCAGSGTGVTTAGGTLNFLAKFSGSQAIANSLLSDNGTTLTYTGSGGATLGVASTTTGLLNLYNSGNAFYTRFQTSTSQGADITYTLPIDDGTDNYVLTTNGSGVLAWESVSGAGGISGSGTTNTIPKFTSSTAIGDSLVTDDGTTFAINTNMFTVTEANGNTVVAGTLAVNGAALTTDDTTFALLNGTATTVNAFGAATALNLGASGGLTLTPGGNVTVPLINSKALTLTSDLSGGARSTYPLVISQANDASNNNSVGLINLSNSDTGSTGALLNISQVSTGTGINIAGITGSGGRAISIADSLASGDYGLYFASTISGGRGIRFQGTVTSGSGIYFADTVSAGGVVFGGALSGTGVSFESTVSGWGIYFGSLVTGYGVYAPTITSTGIGLYGGVSSLTSGSLITGTGTSSGTLSAFTGDIIGINPTRTHTGATSITDTGNYLDIARSLTVNNAGGTFANTGDLVTFSSNMTQTSGTITDSGKILALTQSFASATGNVLDISNAGTGNAIEIGGAGTRKINSTSGDLALATTTSGNITLTPSSATALVNVLTGNLKVGNGTPTQTLSGESAYIEGLLEIDGVIYNDGLTSGTPTGSVCYNSSNAFIQCSGGSGLSGSGTSGQIAFFNGTNSITSETSGFGWDTTNKLFTLTSTATTQSAAAFVANSLTTGNVLSLSSTSTAGGGSGSSYLLNLSRSGTNSNSTHTAYGIASAVTNTGTSSTNIAGYFSASGASNNYGIIVPNGGGYVGIGTSAPGALLELDAMTGTGTNAGMIIDADTADNAFIDFYEEGVQSANIFWNGSSNYLAINSLTNDTIISSANLSLVGIGTTNPARKLEINSLTGVNLRLTYADGDGSATNYSDFLMSSSGDLTIDSSGSDTNISAGDNFNLLSGAGTFNQTFTGTTTTAFNLTANSLTTGEAMDITAALSPTDGSTNEFIDLNFTNSPSSSAANTSGIDLAIADATTLGNLVSGYLSTITLTNNAAKVGTGYYALVTSNSTTADNLFGYSAGTTATGIITTGTRGAYGYYSTPTAGAESTGGTTNVYGFYSQASGDVGAGGTLNAYGLYVANGTYDTDGTSAAYGVYVAALSGADNNYSLYLADTTGGANTGITFGADTNLYRSAADTLRTDDAFIAGTTLSAYGTTIGLNNDADANNVLSFNTGAAGVASGDLYWGDDLLCDVSAANCGWSTGGGANTALSNLAAVAINTSLLPGVDDSIDLGDDTHRWRDLYLGGETIHLGASTADEAVLSYTSASNTLLIDNVAAGVINIGTTALAQTMTLGNATGATSLALTTGTGGIAATSTTITGTALTVTSNSLTTGKTLALVGTASPTGGGTGNFVTMAFTNSPSSSTNQQRGIYLTLSDSTGMNNGLRGIQNEITVVGNNTADVIGYRSEITSSATTGGSAFSYRARQVLTGAMTTLVGTTQYGVYSDPTNTGNHSNGVLSLYGYVAAPSYTSSGDTTGLDASVYGLLVRPTLSLTTGGTGNIYGVYVENPTSSTTGTTANYGINIEAISGADTNIGLRIMDAGTYSLQLASTDGDAASGITFGTDTNLYRSAANMLKTDDGLIVSTLTTGSTALCVNGSNQLATCTTTPPTAAGTSGQIAFFNGASSLISETSGFGWDTTNKLFTIVGSTSQSTQTTASITSTANSYTTGKLLNVDLTQSAATGTSVSGNIAAINFAPTYSTAVTTPAISGNVLNIARSATTNSSFVSTLTLSGAVASISSNCTQTTGTCTDTSNVLSLTQSYAANTGSVLGITNSGTGNNGINITTNALTTGTGLNIASTSTGLTSGSLLKLSTATTGNVSGGVFRIDATGDFSGNSNGGLVGIFADATTSGFAANISADAMTTGRALNITSTSTGMTTGSLLFAESATTGTIATNGLIHFDAYGNYSSSSNVGLLQVQANATTGGTVQNIQANALTSGTALRIASTGTGLTTGSILSATTATTGNVTTGAFVFTGTGNFSSNTTPGLFHVGADSVTTATIQSLSGNALTTGIGQYIGSTGTGLTSGSLLRVSSATTGNISSNGIVSLNATGNYASTSNIGLLSVKGDSTTAGTIQNISGTALTTGVGLHIASSGTGLTSGSLLYATSGTTGAIATNGAISLNATAAFTSTSNQGFLSVNANSTTAGTAESIFTNALTTGVGLYVTNSSASNITTGSLIRAEAGGTGTVATNGVIQYRHGGNFASTSNVGFVSTQANSTTAGTIESISGDALTTGVGLYIDNGTSAMTSGSLIRVAASGTGAIATNGIVSFNHAGVFTSTSNMGFVNINASATTAGTVDSIFADALTTGVGSYTSVDALTTGTGWSLNSTSTGFTSGKLQAIDWSPGSSTTATGDLLSLNIGANGLGANFLNIYNNGSSVFSVNQTQFTTSLPANFTAAGDVSLAYDLNFTNATASYVTSDAPLYIVAGETFNSSNLVLQTYNNGAVVVDSALSLDTQITLTANSTTPSVAGGSHFNTNNSSGTLITNFTNGTDGQIIYIQIGDANTDFDCTGSNLNCGTTNITIPASGDVFGFIYNGTNWNLISWMRNSVDNSAPANGVDLAELFYSTEALVPGDVVSIDQAGTAYVKKSTVQYDNKAMGVIATQPGIILGPQAENTFPVALVGRVPVKVDPNSPAIREGDFLTASGTSGKAMKAMNPGQMLGRALEDWTPGSGQTTVLMFVNASYADPNRALANLRFDENGQLIIPTQSTDLPRPFMGEGWGEGSGSLSLDEVDSDIVTGGSGTFANLFANVFNSTNQTVQNALEAGEVVSNTIFNKSKSISVELTDGLKVSSRGLSSEGTAEVRPLLSISKDGEASVSGKLSAPEISASQATIETLTVKNLIVENLMQNGATGSATIDFAEQGLKADVGEFDLMTINTDLTVAGTATLADVAVMNQMKFNNNLTINETSINTLGTDLEIQPLKQAAVSFMADAVRIETDGTVTFNENVAFKKDVEVAGVLSATTIKGALDDIKVASASAATEVTDTEVEASGSAGMVTLKAGELSVKVNNPKVTEDSLIFITPKGTTYGKTLYIKSQIDGSSFTVGVEGTTPAASNIKFNFLIVN